MTVVLGALALGATACNSLSRPEEITISAEPIARRNPPPAPAGQAPAPAAMPAPAAAQGG
jgi:hypothetical protein